MDQHDRDNLEFLLSADADTLQDWYSKTSPDDHNYAGQLLNRYHEELKVKLSLLSMDDNNPENTSEATNYLRKFQLK